VTLTAIVLSAAAIYLLACWAWPFAACRACHGDKRRRSPTGRSWRTCKRCKGTGQRLRVGRRIWNHWSRTYERGNR